MGLPYPTKVILPFDIATAQDMNERHANDVALANGSGLDDGAVTADKIDFTTFTAIEATNTTTFTSSSTTPVVITGATVTLTIPQGVSKIKLTGVVRTTNSTNFLTTNVGIYKNGASVASGAARNISGGASQYQDTIPLLALDSVSSGQSITYDLRIFCTAETGAMTVGNGWASLIVEVAG